MTDQAAEDVAEQRGQKNNMETSSLTEQLAEFVFNLIIWIMMNAEN